MKKIYDLGTLCRSQNVDMDVKFKKLIGRKNQKIRK